MKTVEGYNEATLDDKKLSAWLKDVANNTQADFLVRMEVVLVNSD